MKKVSVNRMLVLVGVYCLFANVVHPITPAFFQSLQLEDYMFGVAFAAMAFTNFLFSPLAGKLTSLYGASVVGGVSLCGYGICQYCFGLASNSFQVVCARLAAGFFISFLSVSQLMYIIDHSNEANKGTYLAGYATITSVVSTFGYLLGGLIGEISMRLNFIVQSIGLIVTGILWLMMLKDDNKEKNVDFALADLNPFVSIINIKDILTPMIGIFLLINIATAFGSNCYEQCFNYYVVDHYGLTSGYNGALKALLGFIALLANSTLAVYLMKKTDIFHTIKYVLIGCTVVLIAIVFSDNLYFFVLANVLFFSFNSVYQPVIQNMLSKFGLKDNSGLVGAYNSMRSLGMVIGSLFAGFIYEIGPSLSFAASSLMFAIAVILSIILFEMRGRKNVE